MFYTKYGKMIILFYILSYNLYLLLPIIKKFFFPKFLLIFNVKNILKCPLTKIIKINFQKERMFDSECQINILSSLYQSSESLN